MDVRIGIIQTAKELDIELPADSNQSEVLAGIEKQLSTDEGFLWLSDRKGRRVGVPVAKVAYIEVGTSNEERRVGFGAL